jgi:feruloyl esterase
MDDRPLVQGVITMPKSAGSLRSAVRVALGGGLIAFASMGVVAEAQAQAFADVKQSLVDYSKADLEPHLSCEEIGKYKSADIAEIHATAVAGDGATPAHCRVTGVLKPEIAFEVSLPPRWNGRFYMIGNGGHAGESLDDPGRVSQRNAAVQMGFAFAQTNTGHDSRKETGATFVLSNPQKAIDYAYRAVHLTATTAKAITKKYYARPVTRAYWNSCSNGGRQGLIEAQRYPDDFDGLIVNAPWVSQTGFTIGALWNQRAVAGASLTAEKLALVAGKVMEKCDALDGVKDRLIDDPRKCSFDAHNDVAACAAGSDGANCLTSAQADAVMKVYSGPQGNGKTIFPGYMPGSEAPVASARGGAPASAWMGFIVPATAGARAADFNLADNTMRYLVFTPPKPDYDSGTFDFDRDPHLLDAWSRKVDATSTDLAKFRARGGKLLMTYGWADQVLQPLMGVNYYEQVMARVGPKTTDFFRLFMVPGMTHCSGGNGTDRFDSVSALVDWVEKGKAPDVLHASQVVDDKVVRTRPLCPYPRVARYSGRGSSDEAANFSCAMP